MLSWTSNAGSNKTLWNEEDIFKLPEVIKHPKEQDDTSYAVDDMKVILYDCVQEVLMVNPFHEYLKEVNDFDEN